MSNYVTFFCLIDERVCVPEEAQVGETLNNCLLTNCDMLYLSKKISISLCPVGPCA